MSFGMMKQKYGLQKGGVMSIATVDNTGQLTVPEDILNFLNIKTGDQINFVIKKNQVILQPTTVDLHEKNESANKQLLNSGLVGCAEAEPTLSENYKSELLKIMQEKHVENY